MQRAILGLRSAKIVIRDGARESSHNLATLFESCVIKSMPKEILIREESEIFIISVDETGFFLLS